MHLRGNTAAGKTRAIRGNIPELEGPVEKTKDLPHRAVNPDNFKVDLVRATPDIPLTSSQVHEESSMLARQLESRIRDLRTSDGTEVGSLLIDKRLAKAEDVVGYGKLAAETSRQLNVYDVDAPLENSLAGVLERKPGGTDPLPPYDVISKGFKDVRANRVAVLQYFQKHPELGKYELYGTTAVGAKVKVAEVVNGKLAIHDKEQFAQVTKNPATDPAFQAKANEKITADAVEGMVAKLPPERAATVREVMRPHLGQTWKQALDQHSLSS